MLFYPVMPPDVTLSCAEDAALGLLGQAGMVAVRVADLASPARPGLGRDGRTALTAAGAGGSAPGTGWSSSSRWRWRARWSAATGGCRLAGTRLITPGSAWPRRGWMPWAARRA